jgi:hypothetical protein
LSDPDSSVRSEALWSLGRAGGLASAQIDAVVVVLRDSEAATRRRAVATIGEMGDSKQAITAAAKARVAERSRGAIAALAEAGPRRRGSCGSEVDAGEVRGPGACHRGPSHRNRRLRLAARPRLLKPALSRLLRERKITMESGSYFQALAGTDVSVVRAFLDSGMSASAPVAGSGPPLLVMLQGGDACAPSVRPTKAETKTLMKLLLDRGADANRGDGNGFTPLMAASMKGCGPRSDEAAHQGGCKGRGGPTRWASPRSTWVCTPATTGLEELIAAGYRLPPDKARAYEKAFADKPAVLALVKKANAQLTKGKPPYDNDQGVANEIKASRAHCACGLGGD